MQTKSSGRIFASADTAIAPRGLDILAAAKYLGVPAWFIRTQLIYGRLVPFSRLGRRYIFDRTDLDAYLESAKSNSVPLFPQKGGRKQ